MNLAFPYIVAIVLAAMMGTTTTATSAPWWMPILLTLLSGGTLAAVFSAVKFFVNRRDKRRNSYQSIIRDQTAIQHELNMLVSAGGSLRAFVIRMSNGGGIPRRGACLFASVSYEATGGKDVPVILDDWQKRRLDPESLESFLPMLEDGECTINSDDLKEDCDISVSWSAAGVKCGRLYEIGQIGTEYFFIATNFASRDELTHRQLSAVNDSVAKIRYLVKKGPTRALS